MTDVKLNKIFYLKNERVDRFVIFRKKCGRYYASIYDNDRQEIIRVDSLILPRINDDAKIFTYKIPPEKQAELLLMGL
jgi:hypothetical protein